MVATVLNVLESLLSIGMISTPFNQVCGCGFVINNPASGDEVPGSSPCMGDLSSTFSINDHSKYQNIVFFLFSNW